MTWETVIGLETHVELATVSKLLCSCSTRFGAAANTQCCGVCAGLPGALPSLNAKAVDYAVIAGLALGCEIAHQICFDRKHYLYPDLPKSYQVTQLRRPIAQNGLVELDSGARVRIRQLHLEEDAGKLLHDAETGVTLCDYNRCGIPLIEIVTQPDFRTPDDVISYLELMLGSLRYLGVSDCKMEQGSLRCDVNISVRPAGSTAMGQRTELKNLGSLKAIASAIRYEAKRQITLIEGGQCVLPETRRWDENAEVTHAMRAKEAQADYRFLPEPDLTPFSLADSYIAALRAGLPALPQDRRRCYRQSLGLSGYDAEMITSQKALADLFEAAVALGAPPKQCANWIMGAVLRALSALELEAKDMTFSPAALARLIALVEDGTLNRGTAEAVFDAIFERGGDVDRYVSAHSLGQVSDQVLIAQAVAMAFAGHPQSVADYRSGKKKALGFLVGQVMRHMEGKGNPQVVNQAIRDRLDSGI